LVSLDVFVLDHDHVPPLTIVLDWQIQMNCYFRAIDVVDLAIIAYTTHKRDLVPVTKHTIANVIGMFVPYAIEVISLIAHFRSFGIDELHSLRMQSQRRYLPTSNRLVQARSSLAL
jgi:hypothetical protein